MNFWAREIRIIVLRRYGTYLLMPDESASRVIKNRWEYVIWDRTIRRALPSFCELPQQGLEHFPHSGSHRKETERIGSRQRASADRT